jgi:hypothetical protein
MGALRQRSPEPGRTAFKKGVWPKCRNSCPVEIRNHSKENKKNPSQSLGDTKFVDPTARGTSQLKEQPLLSLLGK